MAARTTVELVGGIIELDDAIDLSPFIEAAAALVDSIEEDDEDNILTPTRLELVERWLSAHFYAIRDPRPTSERAGPVSASYQSQVGFGLKLSHYGQMAIVFDATGTLKALSNGLTKATVAWLGTEEN